MEALAVVSLVGTIAQFIDYSTRIVERLNEFRSAGQNAPNAFRSVVLQLRLLRTNLEKTQALAQAGKLDARSQEDVDAVVQACLHQAQRVEAMLTKSMPVDGESKIRRGVKIMLSVHQEAELKEITRHIEGYVLHLIHHQALNIDRTPPPASRPAPPRTVSHSIMPFAKDTNFAGRESQLSQLDRLFRDGNRAALFGLGGIGKSQIAIEYSHRFLETDPGAIVLWVYASSIARVDEAFQAIADRAQLAGFDDPSVSKYELVSQWLSEEASGSWLMILDNADAEDTFFSPVDSHLNPGRQKTIADYIPSAPNGKALITSRSKTLATRLTHRNHVIEVPNLSDDEARAMLESAIGKDKLESDTDVRRLITALEHLPLAIAQAAAFIDENDITITEYLEVLEDGDHEVINVLSDAIEDSRRDRESLNSVIASWKLSFDYLRAQRPEAADLLSLMCVFDGKSIPERLLMAENQKRLDFIKAVGTLKSFSLVTEDRGQRKYTVHRLIHLATRVWIENEGQALKWQRKGVEILSRTFPAGDPGDWSECLELEPHANSILNSRSTDPGCQTELISLLLRSARDRYHQYHIETALERASRAQSLIQQLPGGPARETWSAKCLTLFSWCHFGRNDFQQAVKNAEEALSIYEELLGPNAPETMQARSRLSKFLMKRGDLDRAYQIQIALLEAQRSTLGPHHDDVLFTMNRLVGTLRRLKRYEEALEISDTLVAARRQASGTDHFATLCAVSGRAKLLYKLNRTAEALATMQTAYDGFSRAFGETRLETKEALECMQEYTTKLEGEESTAKTQTRIIVVPPSYTEATATATVMESQPKDSVIVEGVEPVLI